MSDRSRFDLRCTFRSIWKTGKSTANSIETVWNQRGLGTWSCTRTAKTRKPKTVFPDVIAHRRGTKQNFLVLEFKKSTSHVDRETDRRKLLGYKRQLGYAHALFIEVGTGGQANIAALEWI